MWSTPTVGDASASGSRNTENSNAHPGLSLTDQVREDGGIGRLWPTPQSRDWKSGETSDETAEKNSRPLSEAVKRWPTPRAEDSEQTAGHRGTQDTLTSAMRAAEWPTPQARDQHTYAKTKRGANSPGGTPLCVAAVESEDAPPTGTLALNPDWVEWLMNWPVGWTSLEPLAPDSFAVWLSRTLDGTWWSEDPAELDAPERVERVSDRVPHRTNRLRAIGNGQVPAVVVAAWKLLGEK